VKFLTPFDCQAGNDVPLTCGYEEKIYLSKPCVSRTLVSIC
jgi:hypothetical protein